MGIPVDENADPAAFLDAMALHKTYAAAHGTRIEGLRRARGISRSPRRHE
ncbi:hypothetical protein [Streptomyces sp. NPDC052015]